jgi:hypothetical protein
MRSGPSYNPSCERCSKPHEAVAGMIAIHKDERMPTVICWDCIDDLKKVADYHRSRMVGE